MAFDTPPLTSWSYSRLEVFERCPYRAQLQFVDKVAQGEDPKRDEALERGKRVHDAALQYVKGEIEDMPKELHKFGAEFDRRRERYSENPELFILEEQWAFNITWQSTGWFDNDTWLRMILDCGEYYDPQKTALRITDYKTGKKEGNEVKHSQQGQLFVIGTFMKLPQLEAVKVEFEYLDHGKKSLPKTYTREQAMTFLPSFERRGKALTEAVNFPPKPNRINCAYCPFGPSRGNGACQYGVEV